MTQSYDSAIAYFNQNASCSMDDYITPMIAKKMYSLNITRMPQRKRTKPKAAPPIWASRHYSQQAAAMKRSRKTTGQHTALIGALLSWRFMPVARLCI